MDANALPETVRRHVEPFLTDLKAVPGLTLHSAYVIGAAARGEADPRRPQIAMALVLETMTATELDGLARLGRRWGKRGFHAPIVLTHEHVRRAQDVFPIEFLDWVHNHACLLGTDLFAEVAIDRRHLRLQCERELRLWLLNLSQAYLRSAGEASWLAGWFVERVEDLFPLLRAVLVLLGGDGQAGNTETVRRLERLVGGGLSVWVEAWEARKEGRTLPRDQARRMFEAWEKGLSFLVEKVDGLSE